MSEIKSEIDESVKDFSENVSKTSISKHYKSTFSPSRFDTSLRKSENMTDLLKNKIKSTKIINEKYANMCKKVEKLKKEYENEISKINGLRNKSLYLYKLKKYADEWTEKREKYLENLKKEQNSHKMNSMNNKAYQEMLNLQTKSEMIASKHENALKLKAQMSSLENESHKNIERISMNKKKYHQKIIDLHKLQEKKKQKYKELKIYKENKKKTEKIAEETKKQEFLMRSIENKQKEELETLKKIRNSHKLHELALFEFSDLKNERLKIYEKKYKNPIKLDPIK